MNDEIKPKEFWVLPPSKDDHYEQSGAVFLSRKDCHPVYLDNLINVIEKSAYDKLLAENYVLRDANLRTYDGLAQRHARYKKALISICNNKCAPQNPCEAREALDEDNM